MISTSFKTSIINLKLLIAGVIISSCHAQETTNTTSNGSAENDFQKQDYGLSLTNKDPLFFIDGQLCAWVRDIQQDSKGNLWFGTNHYGVMRYNGDTLEYFDANKGMGHGRINVITEDDYGNVWFGNFNGLTKYQSLPVHSNNPTFSHYIMSEKNPQNDVWSMITDRNGLHWIGTSEGVFQFDGKKFNSFPLPGAAVEDTTSILSYNRITCILEDRKGTLWFGTDGFGIWQFDPGAALNNAFMHLSVKNGLPGNNIAGIMEDANGNIWIATMFGGISSYDGERFKNYTESGVVQGVEVGGLLEDSKGNIWFSAEGHGVYCYDGVTFKNIHRIHGLETDGVISIFEDREGRYWFGGWGGLFRYYPEKEANGERSVFSVNQFGPWDD